MKAVVPAVGIIAGIIIVAAAAFISTSFSPRTSPISSSLTEESIGPPGVNAQGYQYVYQQDKNTLTVSGRADSFADPNKVDVYLGAETEASTALESQQGNAQALSAIRAALTNIGISADDIKTTSFSISAVYSYENYQRKRVLTGYKTTHLLKVSSRDITKAGQIIDAATSAGANMINNVAFGLTSTVQNELRNEVLETAAQNARDKAESIARGLEVNITRVVQASEGSVGVTPYYSRGESLGASSGFDAPPTEISAGSVQVSATVSVVYEIS